MTSDEWPPTNMPLPITIPRLGWSMDEGTFGEWLKEEGDLVEPGDPVFSLESDKAVQDVESVDGGILHILQDSPQEGDAVEVGMLVGFLLTDGEEIPTADDIALARAQSTTDSASDAEAADSISSVSAPSTDQQADSPQLPAAPKKAISPRAARLAGQLGVDWSHLTGTGRNGRIRERDIRVAASQSGSQTSRERRLERGTTSVLSGGLRQTIAERMLYSVQTTAPVTLTTRVDATNLVGLRQQFKSSRADVVPGYHDIIAKLTAAALRAHPVLNCQWQDGEIVEPDGIHIGIAVDTDAGLLVPVIRHCDQLSLAELAQQSRDVINRARGRKCSPDELSGGTFSITNLGAFGIDAFTPIINPPQTAVLGIGAIRREPVVLPDDRIEPRDQLTLSLTFDHRVTDGAPAARFLQTLADNIENPAPLLIQNI